MDERSAIELEARQVLGAQPDSVTPLAHAGSTRGVWRVASGSCTAVAKILVAPPPASPRAVDPHSMRYWRREERLYAAGTPAPYAAAGIRCPRLLARFDRPDGSIALWLEEVLGRPAVDWDLAAFGRALRRLGRAQGAYLAGAAPLPATEWLSRHFLRQYLAERTPQDDVFVANDDAWRHPDIGRHFPPEMRDELRRLRADRDRLLRCVEASPPTLAHLDFWPQNLLEVGGEMVVLDWGFAGIGAAGEDPGNVVPDSIFDFQHPASILPDLDRTVFEAYVAGLRDAGWNGDDRMIRLAMTAAGACKYGWIAGATLARAAAGTATQPIYGGVEIDAERLFETRAAVLRHLLGWADEARRLAQELGVQ